MDLLTLAMAKNYTDSTRIAYVDGGSATFDSTNPGELVHAAEHEYIYKFSPLYPSEKDMSDAKVVLATQGMTIGFTVQKEGELNDNVTLYLFLEWEEAFLVVSDKAGSFDFGDGNLITLPTAGMYLFMSASVDSLTNHFKLEFTWGTVKTIDPKFIPPMDSIILNGADGKQYKLTVSGGALNIAEVV